MNLNRPGTTEQGVPPEATAAARPAQSMPHKERRPATQQSRTSIQRMLRTRETLRQTMLLREIIGPPKALE
jgi:hypothetical protein